MKTLLFALVVMSVSIGYSQQVDTATVSFLIDSYFEYQKECIEDSTVWVFTPTNQWMTLREYETHPEWKRYSSMRQTRTRQETAHDFFVFLMKKIKEHRLIRNN